MWTKVDNRKIRHMTRKDVSEYVPPHLEVQAKHNCKDRVFDSVWKKMPIDDKMALMEMTDFEDNLPSDVAARDGHEYLCHEFLEFAKTEKKEILKRIQSSIILSASEAGQLAIVKLVFPDKDESPDLLQLVDEQGRTCLHKAAEKGNWIFILS